MKKTCVLFFLFALIPAVYASDTPAEISQTLSFNSVIPLSLNAYTIIPGMGYDFKVIKDAFLFTVSLNAHAGIGRAIKDSVNLFGIYKNEWRTPEAEVPGRTAVYLRGETAVSFGWNIFSFFAKRQFIVLTLSALFEHEDIGGKAFLKLGRYSSCISAASEAFELFGNGCMVFIGYGSVSFSDRGKPGTLASYIKAGLSMEFKQPGMHEDIYKRGAGQENNEKPAEGETVW
jgi:hypothetical protein